MSKHLRTKTHKLVTFDTIPHEKGESKIVEGTVDGYLKYDLLEQGRRRVALRVRGRDYKQISEHICKSFAEAKKLSEKLERAEQEGRLIPRATRFAKTLASRLKARFGGRK